MPIPSKPVPIIQIRWDLAKLSAPMPEIPKPFAVRTGGLEELEDALRVIEASYDLLGLMSFLTAGEARC